MWPIIRTVLTRRFLWGSQRFSLRKKNYLSIPPGIYKKKIISIPANMKENLVQIFAAIFKKLGAQGPKRVNYSRPCIQIIYMYTRDDTQTNFIPLCWYKSYLMMWKSLVICVCQMLVEWYRNEDKHDHQENCSTDYPRRLRSKNRKNRVHVPVNIYVHSAIKRSFPLQNNPKNI